MEMKYFRFLYGETGRCSVHFGEIRDTKTEESFTFLCMGRVRMHVNQEKSEHTLFLCPKRLNLVVLGETDEDSIEATREYLSDTVVDALVYSANTDIAKADQFPGVKRVIRLTEHSEEYQVELAGWRLVARSYEDGSVMVAHDLAAHNLAAGASYPYKDCVMNVKTVDGNKRCCTEQEPDGYGCALGCTLHQDYDACKYQRKGEQPCVAGTILLPEVSSGSVKEKMIRDVKEQFQEIRFFRVPGATGAEELADIIGAVKDSPYKRYFISDGPEISDEAIAAVSRSSMYHIPVVLEPGRALCCSGMLPYGQ